ncbi:MAG: type 1 glutamine amidotransferase [Sulfolobaceae archaeon]|nr:type 1 glutamine amidotransferase [Sulfolobaceae archaeon]
MKFLAVYNHPVETLGRLKRHLSDVKEVHAEELKGNEEFDSLIIMGGPMGVYESDRYPFLKTEMELVRRAYKENKRVLGICLGSQIIAEALGGKVVKGQFGSELGISRVKLVGELREYLGKDEITVFQWHGDTFSLPPNARLLAYSEKYFQAFRINRILALQFHVEVDSEMVKNWLRVYGGDERLAEEVKDNEKELKNNLDSILKYWLSL